MNDREAMVAGLADKIVRTIKKYVNDEGGMSYAELDKAFNEVDSALKKHPVILKD